MAANTIEKRELPTPRKRLLEMLEGQKVLVETGALPDDPPIWYDPEKFKRGQDFVRKHFVGISLAHFISLLTLLISPGLLKVMIFTQNPRTVLKSLKRYITTLVHMLSWYSGDVWQKDDPSRQFIQIVSSIHNHGARTMNSPEKKPLVNCAGIAECGQLFTEDRPMLEAIHQDAQQLPSCPYTRLKTDDKSDYLYLNQFDMAETQFTFVGTVILFPHKFGIIYADDDDLRGFIHLWRCLGYLMGIQDRYGTMCAMMTIWMELGIFAAFSKTNVTAEHEHIMRALSKGISKYYPGVSYESLFAYYVHAVGMPATNFIRLMTWGQYINYMYLRLVFCVLCWIPCVMALFNAITKLSMGLVVDRSNYWWPTKWNPPQVEELTMFWSIIVRSKK